MLIADSILMQDIHPSERRRDSLLAAVRCAPRALTAADLPWARWLSREIEGLLDGYRRRRAERLAGCHSGLQMAATDSLFRLAIDPLAREHADLRRRIASAELRERSTNLIVLPAFLPRPLRNM